MYHNKNILRSVISFFIGKHVLSILIYHRVLDCSDPYIRGEIDKHEFESHMRYLSRFFMVISLAEALDRIKSNSIKKNCAVITFDDGYKNNIRNALPILKKYRMPATFFVSTGFLDGGLMWNDIIIESLRRTSNNEIDLRDEGLGYYSLKNISERSHAITNIIKKLKYLDSLRRDELVSKIKCLSDVNLPDDIMMNEEDISHLARSGMELGAHTVTHPILSRISDDDASFEIQKSKHDLESISGGKVFAFAYPNGRPGKDYLYKHVDMVRSAGFSCALSTAPGVCASDCDVYQLPRFTPWDRSYYKFIYRMWKNMKNDRPSVIERN